MIEATLALVFGLIIGSFLNVCIHRWPRNRSVIRPRSHCVRCRKPIAPYDNIPVLSYLILRGRCRHCGKRISWRYPLVELLTGGLFFWIVLDMGPTLVALKSCVFAAILVALIFCDLEKRLLPDELTKGGILVGLAFALFVPVPGGIVMILFGLAGLEVPDWVRWLADAALGALLPALLFWLAGWVYLKVRDREGLGFGDVNHVLKG